MTSERRQRSFEVRLDGDDGNPELVGFALVYDVSYRVGGSGPAGFDEVMVKGAARQAAATSDVRLLANHDGLPLARTASGTLELRDRDEGLYARAILDGSAPMVRDVISAMQRGDLNEMSLAFTVADQRWNDSYTERRIRRLERLYDVSVVTYPANPATVAQLRREKVLSSATAARWLLHNT